MEADTKDHKIEVERSFNVDVETLFKAWTEAEQLKKWWHPMGESLTDVKNELEDGGAVEYYVGEAGLEITGKYSEVSPNEKLVYSWNWNMSDEGSENGYVLNVSFLSEGEGSKLHVIQEGFSGEEFLKTHQDGWEKGFNDLESYLSRSSEGKTDSSENAEQSTERKSADAESENSGETKSSTQTQSQSQSSEQPQRDNLKSDEGMSDRSGGYNEAPDQAKVGGG